MKRTLSFMVMALALLLTQCRKPEVKFPSPVAPEGTTVSMTVTAGPGGKTDISETGAIIWSTGDKLYVGYNGAYVGCLEIKSGQNTPTGWFSGNVTLPTDTENGEKTFHFFYLGSAERTLEVGATTVDVDFSSQEIYADANNKLVNASKHHVGYGSAKGTVAGSEVTGINVTLVSKVALARFSFTKNSTAYDGALTLSGDGIYNSMTVGFGGSFTGKTKGNISLRGSHSERYVMLVPPVDVAAETLNFDGGAGTTILENGIEANKFYGKNEAIPVTINAYVDLGLSVKWATCNLGATNGATAESWYGDYYQWGGVTPVTSTTINVGWAGCPHTKGTYSSSNKKVFTKYVPTDKPEYWAGGGAPDNKSVLESSDDAATQEWGSAWRMPTKDEFQELSSNTTKTWYKKGNTDFNGVAGWKCVSRKAGYTDKYIFLPAAGSRSGTYPASPGSSCRYWYSVVSVVKPYIAQSLIADNDEFYTNQYDRCYGYSVRPVLKPQN